MSNKKLIIYLITCITVIVMLSASVYNYVSEGRRAEATVFAMDTVMSLTAEGKKADKAVALASEEIKRLESLFSVNIPSSDINMLNENKKASVSEETFFLIKKALEYYNKTNGVLNIAVFPAVSAWGFTTGSYSVPSDEKLSEIKKHINPGIIYFDDKTNTITINDPYTKLDLGAVAKGYASDRIIDIFKENGIESGIISLGGNVKTLGKKKDGSLWNIAVQNPDIPDKYIGTIEVYDKAVVTSGDYQRYFERDGKRYHHIIDPDTCKPAESGLASVTVVASEGLAADALSTALFIMGKDKAISYWKENKDLFGVLFVEKDGKVSVTSDLAESFKSYDDTKEIEVIYAES